MALITGFKQAKFYSPGARNPNRVYAAVYHMAEGYGTVSWLTHPSNDNSSTLVVEKDGDVWQMVKVGDMDHSLHVAIDSDTHDAPNCGIFNIQTAGRVLSPATGLVISNHESVLPYIVSIEVEGYASTGPNTAQTTALRDKVAPWIKANFPNVRGNLGHRDFQDYKACPGCKFPWAVIGGHGLFSAPPPVQEEPLQSFTWNPTTAKLGNLTVKTDSPHSYMRLVDGSFHPATPPFPKRAFGPVTLLKGIGSDLPERRIGFIIPDEAAFLLATDVVFVPDASTEVLTAQIATLKTNLAAANTKITQARTVLTT